MSQERRPVFRRSGSVGPSGCLGIKWPKQSNQSNQSNQRKPLEFIQLAAPEAAMSLILKSFPLIIQICSVEKTNKDYQLENQKLPSFAAGLPS
jgi:hypothetical protein